ncbi:MAG: hypothetical protein E7463_13935, partial [Ruminococcaceae bacterium]|nr:hypothetical protein [Oscillospiraceae bacterium]
MKRRLSKGIRLLLMLAALTAVLCMHAFAYDLYETTKADVPVWSEASSLSKEIRKLSKKGTKISIVSTKTNIAGNLWGKTVMDTWIYMGNLKKSSASLPETGGYRVIKDDVPLRTKPTSNLKGVKFLDKGDQITIKSVYYNDVGNLWGTTSDGYAIYMGNVEYVGHVHKGAMCGMPKTSYKTIDESYHQKIVKAGDDLCSCGYVMKEGATTKTKEAHTFKNGACTACGQKAPHQHKAIKCANPTTTYEKLSESKHYKIVKAGDELCSCGAVVKAGATTRTKEAHTFKNGKCSACGQAEKHQHVAVMCGMPTTTYEQLSDSQHYKVVKAGDDLCSCGQVMK